MSYESQYHEKMEVEGRTILPVALIASGAMARQSIGLQYPVSLINQASQPKYCCVES